MKEVIILEIKEPRKSHLVQEFLKQKKIDYRVLVENQLELKDNSTKQRGKRIQKTDIFANYREAIKNQERERELKLWDNVDLDEQLNNDGEWWS